MKKLYLVLVLALLAQGCSRGSGVYVGEVIDVGWEGFFKQTCEVEFRSSAAASTSSKASSYDRGVCDRLMNNIGKKFKVQWRNCRNCFALDTDYEITSLEEVQ